MSTAPRKANVTALPQLRGEPDRIACLEALERQVEEALKRFERVILARPEVMECYLMTGRCRLPAACRLRRSRRL